MTYTFDAENRVRTRGVSGGSVAYAYDGGGAMVKRTNADGTSTVYIGSIFEKNFSASAAVTGTTKWRAS